MLNALTKYSTRVTDGSTGSTSYVPMMPRAKGFCITTHKRTQEAGSSFFLLVYLRGNKKAAAFNFAAALCLEGGG